MSEMDRIREQMKRAFEGGAWHGPAVREALEGVDATIAARRPIGAAHSIWEIVLHMAAWKEVVTRRLGGDPMKDVPPEVDFPPPAGSGEAGWVAALDRLVATHAALLCAAVEVRDDQLDQPPAPGASSRYVLLHGVAQHDIYHAGQIAVLKKA